VAFDVDKFRESHRPWEFHIGAQTFTARHVSTPAVLAFHADFNGAGNERDRLRALRRLLRQAFPWRPSYLGRGDPVRMLLYLEPAARSEALDSFFESLKARPSTAPQKTMSGARSSTLNPTA
jgi:hypothetical protein